MLGGGPGARALVGGGGAGFGVLPSGGGSGGAAFMLGGGAGGAPGGGRMLGGGGAASGGVPTPSLVTGGGGGALGRLSGALSAARLGGGAGGPPAGRAMLGGGGGAFLSEERDTIPDSDGIPVSFLLRESKISSELFLSDDMIRSRESSAPSVAVPSCSRPIGRVRRTASGLSDRRTSEHQCRMLARAVVLARAGARRRGAAQSASRSARTELRSSPNVASAPSARA
jgi:hypothetical protein